MAVLFLQVFDGPREVFSGEFEGELEIGRQQVGEPVPFQMVSGGPVPRLIVAPMDERTIGRRQVLIKPQDERRVELTNLSSVSSVLLTGGASLEPGAKGTLNLPVKFAVGYNLELRIEKPLPPEPLNSLTQVTLRPGVSLFDLDNFQVQETFNHESSSDLNLIRAIQLTMDVFQMATNSPDFYARACRAAIELVGLDSGRVLLRHGSAWQVIEQAAPDKSNVAPISRYVLDQVVQHAKTFWKSGGSIQDPSQSLGAVHSVVAAPILNRDGDVSGILYGERALTYSKKTRQLTDITELDALLLELVACAVASGLARLQGEDAARRLRLQFEQFFTPELAQHLETHPDMLNGRDADVSVLFCDIRGFSRIAEKIGAARTFDWINDVMGTLSDCVSNHQGVLVDYIGDELMAMWGAPVQQPDHARRACLAAIDMIELLPSLNQRWKSVLNEPFDLGIGISSGPVRAGNMGSNRKFKYGPLGNTVNLASRVQGATKYFKSRLIVTGATAEALDDNLLMRRLADVRVVNIEQPVRLFELPCGNAPNASELCPAYEQALECFEQGDFRKAAQMLTTLMASFPDDGASMILLSRAVSALVDGRSDDHPVWQMAGK